MGSLDEGAVKRFEVCRGMGNHAVNLGVVRLAVKFGSFLAYKEAVGRAKVRG